MPPPAPSRARRRRARPARSEPQKIVDQPDGCARKHAVNDDRPRDGEHLRRKPRDHALRLEFKRRGGDAVRKSRDGHDGTRARRLADAVVHAKPRQQAPQKDEHHGDGAREHVARKVEYRLKFYAQELPDTADQPADDERAQAVVKMLCGRRKGMHIGEIIFVNVLCLLLFLHGAPPLPCAPKNSSRARPSCALPRPRGSETLLSCN